MLTPISRRLMLARRVVDYRDDDSISVKRYRGFAMSFSRLSVEEAGNKYYQYLPSEVMLISSLLGRSRPTADS